MDSGDLALSSSECQQSAEAIYVKGAGMTFIHPNLSEHYGPACDLGDLPHRLSDAGDQLELASALYDATALPPVELRRLMRAMARREGGASVAEAHELAARRLRAMLQLDSETARSVARAFADAFIDLPAEWRERSREVEFSVIKRALHVREFIALSGILPGLREHEAAAWMLSRLPDGGSSRPAAEISAASALASA